MSFHWCTLSKPLEKKTYRPSNSIKKSSEYHIKKKIKTTTIASPINQSSHYHIKKKIKKTIAPSSNLRFDWSKIPLSESIILDSSYQIPLSELITIPSSNEFITIPSSDEVFEISPDEFYIDSFGTFEPPYRAPNPEYEAKLIAMTLRKEPGLKNDLTPRP